MGQERRFTVRFSWLDVLYATYGLLIIYPLVFISIYAYQLASIIAAALLYATAALTIGVAPIFIAPLSDRTGYRIKYAVRALALGSLLFLLSAMIEERIILILMLILASAIIQIGQPLFISYETERNEKAGSSVGKVYLFINTGYFIGSFFFGLTIDYLGFRTASIIAGILGIVISLYSLRIREERIFKENPYSLSIITVIKKTNKFSLASASLVFVPALFFSIVPIYYVYYLAGKALDWGIVNAVSTLTSILASPYVGNIVDRIGIKRVLLIGMVYYPIYYISLLLYPNLLLFAILYSLPFWLFLWIPLFSYSAILSNSYERAIFVSNMNLLIGLFRTLGGIVGGILVYLFGINLFFMIAIISSLILILVLIALKEK